MNNLKGKKLLVLGSTHISLDLVQIAKAEGVYTIVADNLDTGIAKENADEAILISTTDIDALVAFVRERSIDGVFCGPSEFNLHNVRQVCERVSMPFYATKEQLDRCINKASFKKMCREYGVPCIPDYKITERFLKDDLDNVIYPVMVKPADSSGSRGLTICRSQDELQNAYKRAKSFSSERKVIVEKYINSTNSINVKYIIFNNKVYLFFCEDNYMVDQNVMMTHFSRYPSKRILSYIDTIDFQVRSMIEGIGFQNGSVFLQAIVDVENTIFFHEMGPRPSGGMTYKVAEPITGINDIRMQLRYALGEAFSSNEEINKIDPYLNGKVAGTLGIPLKSGVIGNIKGLPKIIQSYPDIQIIQYYYQGDEVKTSYFGTQYSKFARFKLITDGDKEIVSIINFINENLIILDENGNDMIYKNFDVSRLD